VEELPRVPARLPFVLRPPCRRAPHSRWTTNHHLAETLPKCAPRRLYHTKAKTTPQTQRSVVRHPAKGTSKVDRRAPSCRNPSQACAPRRAYHAKTKTTPQTQESTVRRHAGNIASRRLACPRISRHTMSLPPSPACRSQGATQTAVTAKPCRRAKRTSAASRFDGCFARRLECTSFQKHYVMPCSAMCSVLGNWNLLRET
jgi:hypothetical protein